MTGVAIQQMADRVAVLLEQRLGARGKGLGAKLARVGRKLPRRVRLAGEQLCQAATMAQNPKLFLQIDQEAIAGAYDICLRHLNPLDRKLRSRGGLVALASSVAFSLLTVALILLIVLVWRGYI